LLEEVFPLTWITRRDLLPFHPHFSLLFSLNSLICQTLRPLFRTAPLMACRSVDLNGCVRRPPLIAGFLYRCFDPSSFPFQLRWVWSVRTFSFLTAPGLHSSCASVMISVLGLRFAWRSQFFLFSFLQTPFCLEGPFFRSRVPLLANFASVVPACASPLAFTTYVPASFRLFFRFLEPSFRT